jgi:hypothetical protein
MRRYPIPPLGTFPLVAALLLSVPDALPGGQWPTAASPLETTARGDRSSTEDPREPDPRRAEGPEGPADIEGVPEPQATPPPQPHPGERLSVYLMTVGQGEAIWERFSHNAIWIRDQESGWEAAFNWGIFNFDQVDFIPRLIRGTMLYRMAPYDPQAFLEENRRENRAVWVQELALTPEEKWDLLTFVEWNAQPENMYYRYDYYRDNCSTRVRDALDRVLGGRIRVVAEADTTAHTYRWHTRRLLRDDPLVYLGIQTVLGPAADRPLTEWEEAFLPLRLMDLVRDIEVPDGTGGMRPLVVEERQLLGTTRPPVPAEPPFALPWFLLAGLLLGAGILALSRKGTDLAFLGRLALWALAGGWSLVAGLAGTLILGAWLFTDHSFWYWNLNLLQVNPLFFPLFLAFLLFLLRGVYPRWARDTAAGLGVMAGLGLLASLLPVTGQANGEILALTLPLNGALALGSFWLHTGVGKPSRALRSQEKGATGETGNG